MLEFSSSEECKLVDMLPAMITCTMHPFQIFSSFIRLREVVPGVKVYLSGSLGSLICSQQSAEMIMGYHC